MATSRHFKLREIELKDEFGKKIGKRLPTFPHIPIDRLASASDTIIVYRDTDSLDALAHKVYGDGRYWWVIALVNGIKNPLDGDLKSGRLLRIPNNVEKILDLIVSYTNAK